MGAGIVRPKLLDLFCGAGGCSVGYHRGGFDVTGVDIEPHPDYPYEMIVADAMEVLTDRVFLSGFEVA
jgi:DNA (cytosine-5)-methyltransferase 1